MGSRDDDPVGDAARRLPRRIWWVAGLALLLVAGVGVWWRARPVAHIVTAGGDAGGGIGYTHSAPDTPYTVGGLLICLDRPGRASIDAIRPVQPTGGLRVDAFLAVPNPWELPVPRLVTGAETGSITRLSSGPDAHIGPGGDHDVDRVCHPDPTTAPPPGGGTWHRMLYVQYSKPGTATAAETAIAVDYTSAGRHYTLVIPWYVFLCGDTPHDGVAANCPDSPA